LHPSLLTNSPSVSFPGVTPNRIGPVSEPASDRSIKTARPHVLVIDDENLIADSVAAILNRSGFDAVARYSGLAALHYLNVRHPDVVVTDVMLPDLNGILVALSIRSMCPNVRVVLFSGNASAPDMLELTAAEENSFELLTKPVHPANLLKALNAA
jgi:DNA-binding response OmpR family regulator